MIQLRGSQPNTVDKCMEVLTSKKPMRAVVVAPTAYGKSLIVSTIAKLADSPIVLLHNSKELLTQNVSKYKSYGLTPNIYSASLNSREIGDVIFATIGSIKKEVKKLKELGVKYVVIDECQNGSKIGGQLDKFIKDLGVQNVLGLTATPTSLTSNMNGTELRMLNRDRTNLFKTIHHIVPIKEVVDSGYWTPLEYRQIDIDNSRLELNTTGTEFTKESVVMNYIENDLEKVIIKETAKLESEKLKSIVIFMPSVKEAKELSKKIKGSRCVYGDMKASERDKNLEDFKNQEFNVMVNCQILQIGYDNPNIEALIMASPTNSVGLYYQIVGRASRIKEGKDKAVVLDISGNFERFGRIEDFTFENQDYAGGWAMFSGDKMLTNFPLSVGVTPTRKSLIEAKEREKELKNNPQKLNGSLKFHFGKYSNKTVIEVFKENKSYLAWLAGNKEFTWNGDKMKAIKREIFEILKLPMPEDMVVKSPIKPLEGQNSKELIESFTKQYNLSNLSELF